MTPLIHPFSRSCLTSLRVLMCGAALLGAALPAALAQDTIRGIDEIEGADPNESLPLTPEAIQTLPAQPLAEPDPLPTIQASERPTLLEFESLPTEADVEAAERGTATPSPSPTVRQTFREIDDQFSSFVDRVDPGQRPLTPAEARTGLLPLRFRQLQADQTAPTRLHLVDPAGGGPEMFYRGEYFRRDYTVFIPQELAGQDPTLVLGYVSDIDVWEQQSVMSLRINDTPIAGEFPLDAYAEIARVAIPLSQVGVSLRTGENKITVMVRHFDRLKCTLQAANDSWTALFPDLTFLEYTTPPQVDAQLTDSFLRWTFANNFDALTPVSIMTAQALTGGNGTQADLLTAAMFAAQAYGQYSAPMSKEAAATMVPEVVYLPAPRGSGASNFPGLDLAAMPGPRGILIGTRSQLAGIVGSGILGRIDGPFLDIFSVPHPKAAAGVGTILVISGTEVSDVAAAAEYLAAEELDITALSGSASSVRERLRGDREARAERDAASVLTKEGPPWSRTVFIPAEGPETEDGVTVSLSELGMIDTFYDYQLENVGGRVIPTSNGGFYDGIRMIRSLEIDLPPDYFVTDDSTVDFLLRYQHDDSLIGGSILNVFINDNVDASVGVQLPEREASDGIVERRVRLPMADFRPGRNAIGIEVNMPIDPEDIGTGELLSDEDYGPCSDLRRPEDMRVNPGDRRFKLHGDSQMTWESYPRLAELPNLEILSTAGYPFYYAGDSSEAADVSADGVVYFALPADSQGVADTLSAGLTVIAKLGQVVRTKLPLRGTFELPRASDNHVMIIGGYNELQDSLSNAPLTWEAIRDRWNDIGAINTTDFLVSADLPEDEPVFKGVTFENYAPQDLNRERLERLREAYALEREKQADLYRLARQGVSLTDDPLGWIRQARTNVLSFFGLENRDGEELANVIRRYCTPEQRERDRESCEPNRTALVLQFQADERNPTRSTLVFTAVDAAHLNTAAQRLVTPLFWQSMKGDFMTFGANSVSIRTARPEETFFILTDDMNLTNLRLITANVLSRSTLAWALLVAGLVGVAALLNWALVRRVGQNSRLG